MDGVRSGLGRGRGRRGSRGTSPAPGRVEEQIVEKIQSMAMEQPEVSVRDSDATFRGSTRGSRISTGEMLKTKPAWMMSKQGKTGTPIKLATNYFMLSQAPSWRLHMYDVRLQPEIEVARVRKAVVYALKDQIGQHIYRGDFMLYSVKKLDQNPFTTEVTDKKDPTKKYRVTLTYTRELVPGDNFYLMFYDILAKKVMTNLKLQEYRKTYFDLAKAIELPTIKLILYPGFKVTMRSHEKNVLFNVDTTTRVVRTESAVDYINQLKNTCRGGDPQKAVEEKLVGTSVITQYNNKAYRVKSILWTESPRSTFETKDGQTTIADYFSSRYRLTISDLKQPLFLAEPSKEDYHRATKGELKPVWLVPELCNLTGLTDEMRANFMLMKQLSEHLHAKPAVKMEQVEELMAKIQKDQVVSDFLKEWQLGFESKCHQLAGRVLADEKILFANGEYAPELPKCKADWTNAFRGNNKMLSCLPLDHWVLIHTDRDASGAQALVTNLTQVAPPMGMNISKPVLKKVDGPRKENFIKAIDAALKEKNWDMVMIVLPNNNADTYGAIKTRLSSAAGIPSQCVLGKTAGNQKGIKSIATKIAIQLNAKLGGQPWGVKIPVKGAMVVGYDAYRGGKITHGKAVGAMVSTTKCETYSSFYSTVSFHESPDELCRNIASDLKKCFRAYHRVNNELPASLYFYRDGVGESQLPFVYETELKEIKIAITEVYEEQKVPEPKFAFIVVTKGGSTKFFKLGGRAADNPPPGTIVDDIVTLPDRYDFYLIPQTARQGTVSPTHFNVIHDTTHMEPERMQRLTFKFCHLYYNWNGTVAVPAMCQYAHKLASLTGLATGKAASLDLSYQLHYL